MKRFLTPLLPLLLLAAAMPLTAQDDVRYRFKLDFGGRVLFNESGNEDLYRSQVNLGEGVKLFGADFLLSSPHDAGRFFDHIELRADSWGGEPYNTIRASIAKSEVYQVDFDYFNYQYFNAVPNFANPFLEQGDLRSQHRSDFSHRIFNARVTLLPGTRFSPFFAFGRNTRQGPVQTTLRLGNDEFTVRQDLETQNTDIRGGFNLRLDRFSLYLEQGLRLYDDESRIQASGFQDGNSTRQIFGQDLFLENYQAANDYSVNSPFTNAVATFRPWDQLTLRAKVAYSLAELDGEFFDRAMGNFLDFPGLAIFYEQGGRQVVADAKKPSWYGDFSADWQPVHWLLVQQRFNTRRFHVAGGALTQFLFQDITPLLRQTDDPLLETENLSTFLATNYDTEEIVAHFYIDPRFSVRGGYRYQKKEYEQGSDAFEWDRNVLLLGASYRFSSRNRIGVDYELGRTDSPAIFRNETHDFERLRVNGQVSPVEQLSIAGSVSLFDNENEQADIDLLSEHRDFSISVIYTPTRRFSLNADYQRSEIDSDLFFVLPQILQRDRSLYLEKGDYGNVYLSVLLPRDSELSLGYSFWDVTGTFPQSYHRPMARLEFPLHKQVSVYGQWNSYDYKERTLLFPQQYQTQSITMGVKLTFGNEM
ncbi:MAG TPA: hypothetical protein VLU25_08080 [Acidobacteriota bacterium]|nr:hypothetical protein [Acidobacteriota bacterium]